MYLLHLCLSTALKLLPVGPWRRAGVLFLRGCVTGFLKAPAPGGTLTCYEQQPETCNGHETSQTISSIYVHLL